MVHERDGARAEAYALEALDAAERGEFEAHLRSGCEACRAEVARHRATLGILPRDLAPVPPDPLLREQLLDLALAPEGPVDLAAYAWDEVGPGVRVHVLREDRVRHMRACLVWADPGALHPLHRHHGDEVILVLRGGVRDHRGRYGPGEICRSRAGSSHAEEALPGDDCVCYVLYYGDIERLE